MNVLSKYSEENTLARDGSSSPTIEHTGRHHARFRGCWGPWPHQKGLQAQLTRDTSLWPCPRQPRPGVLTDPADDAFISKGLTVLPAHDSGTSSPHAASELQKMAWLGHGVAGREVDAPSASRVAGSITGTPRARAGRCLPCSSGRPGVLCPDQPPERAGSRQSQTSTGLANRLPSLLFLLARGPPRLPRVVSSATLCPSTMTLFPLLFVLIMASRPLTLLSLGLATEGWPRGASSWPWAQVRDTVLCRQSLTPGATLSGVGREKARLPDVGGPPPGRIVHSREVQD